MSWASVFCGTDALHGPLIPQYSPSSRTCLYFGLVPKAALSNRSKTPPYSITSPAQASSIVERFE